MFVAKQFPSTDSRSIYKTRALAKMLFLPGTLSHSTVYIYLYTIKRGDWENQHKMKSKQEAFFSWEAMYASQVTFIL